MAWLKIFDAGWEPARYELPDASVVFLGRAADCARVVPNERLGRHHIKLEREGSRWKLWDMGNGNPTHVNGARAKQYVLLEHDDVATVAEFAFSYEDREEVRQPEIERAIVDRPGDPAAVAVWTDWLIEQGDPLGERLARTARGAPVPRAMNLGLDEPRAIWSAKLGFSLGLLESVELRSMGQGVMLPLLLARLAHLRPARFLRRLQLDLVALAPEHHLEGEWLEQLISHLPPSLEVLDLGYALDRPSVWLNDALASRLPRLRDRLIFRGRRRAYLVAGSVTFDVTPELSIDARGAQVSLSRRGPSGVHGWAAGNQAIFDGRAGSWTLRVGLELQRHLTVNGVSGPAHGLLPGDVIAVGDRRFRFEVE